MRIAFLLLTALLLAAGCKPPKLKPDPPTQRAGGLISQIHDKVDETVVAEMLKDLHLYILNEESSGQMPSIEVIQEYGRKENRKLGQLLESGAIVLPKKLTRSGIWAYQRDSAEKGGWVIVQAGQKKVTAEEFKELSGR